VFGKGKYDQYLKEVLKLIGCELEFSKTTEGLFEVEFRKMQSQSAEQEHFFKVWLNEN
jgi:hypothetical protein